MDGIFCSDIQVRRSRSRCYSSMNYQQYEDFFGTPPKMPDAPQTKPLQDPEDIPELELEDQITAVRQPLKIKEVRTVRYKIETIPEIDGSQDNSMAFQSPRKNFQVLLMKASSKLQQCGDQLQSIALGARKRNRPRSYSQNSPLNFKLKIIDFLKDPSTKQQFFQQGLARKMVKLQ